MVDTSRNSLSLDSSLDSSIDYCRLQQVRIFLDDMAEKYPLCRELRPKAEERLYNLCSKKVPKNYFLGSLAQVNYIFSRLSGGLQLEDLVEDLESEVELAALKAERKAYTMQLKQARLAMQRYLLQTSLGVTILEEKKLKLWLH